MKMTHCPAASVYNGGRLQESRMTGAMVRTGSLRALARGAVIAVLAGTVAACESMQGTLQNMTPQWGDFHPLPDSKAFVPTTMTAYSHPLGAAVGVGPGDLVDGQGMCTGVAAADMPPGAEPGAPVRSVALEMTECEVARALGPPQQAEIGTSPGGARLAVLTYLAGDRPGIYRFVGGRLASVERGAAPLPPPVVAKKPPPKKPKPPPVPPA
jgi:hypothetical protein